MEICPMQILRKYAIIQFLELITGPKIEILKIF